MIPVEVVGLGISTDDLCRVRRVIDSAEVLAGGKRQLDRFSAHPARRILVDANLERAISEIQEAAVLHRVVVLASGDPGFYGIGPRLVEALGAENVVLHPNVTAAQAAFARLKMSWHNAEVISLHGRNWEALERTARRCPKMAVYTDPSHDPVAIARYLLERGYRGVRMCVLEDLGCSDERVRWFSLDEVEGQTFAALNLVVLVQETPLTTYPELHLGMPEASIVHRRGMITKMEVRAVALAKLALQPGQILWDLGAGSGSLSLEAALLVDGGQVIAVERDPQGAQQIRENARNFRTGAVHIVCGQAPQCLTNLPDPDRVFIGGGGRLLEEILHEVASRLRPGGRVVLTAVLLESLQCALNFFDRNGWVVDISHIQVSRGRHMSEGLRLQALNPVWIVAGCPPGGV